jgi:NAD(P)-dependent dehydrogenase (short-subunit alcohol dehydrogenase family)
MQLQDKVIIVTGSTTGIGKAIARRCASEGARVLVHGRDAKRGGEVVQEIGPSARLHTDDLSDPEAAPRVIQAAIDAFGKLDGIVNNAALILRSDLHTTDAATFDRLMAINVRAPLLLIKAARDHLVRSEGSVVNIGSINAYTGEARQLAYSISKAGLMTLSRNLANVLAPERVRITHFNVGWVLTPNEYKLKMSEGLPEGWPDIPNPESVPAGKMTQPEDIAAHTTFWLSDASRPITGSVIDLEQYPIIGRLPLKEGDGQSPP